MSNTSVTGFDNWSSVTEQNIFLDDGLKFVVEVVQPPPASTQQTSFEDCISEQKFDTSSNAELSKRLLYTCALQHGSFYKFFNYRQRALIGLWQSAKAKLTKLSLKISRPPAASKLTATGDRQKGQLANVSFSSHVSLLLLLPILQSQSRTDPSLAGQCAELLLQCLQDCAPNSLAAEPVTCIRGLADLICNWLQQGRQAEIIIGNQNVAGCQLKRETLVAALIALACGRLSIQLFVQVLEVLQRQVTELGKLPVATVLRKALKYEKNGSLNDLGTLQTSRFITNWQFEVPLTTECSDSASSDQLTSLACDGKFLYVVSGTTKGLTKIGTGKHGTLRGAVYKHNSDLKDGWLAIVQCQLLFRPKEFDKEPANLCYVLDMLSLQVIKTIKLKDSNSLKANGEQTPEWKTMQMLSDEVHLYWLWTLKTSADLAVQQEGSGFSLDGKKVDLFIQEFKLEPSDSGADILASPCGDAVVLTRKEEPISSLPSPLPVRLSPTTPPPAQKDLDQMVSCGLSWRSLKETAMFISGNILVMVVPQITIGPTSLLLSFRGPKGPMNYCFSTIDGSCVKHESVLNSPMPRSQEMVTPGLGVCQDCINGRLWSYDGNHVIGEWIAGGFPSCNQVSQQLKTPPESESAAQDLLDPLDTISSIAHHTTFLCRRLDSKLRVASTENDDIRLHGSPDSHSMSRIGSVLSTAITEGQRHVTIAMLAALQTLVKLVKAGWANVEDSAVKETKSLLWKLICTPPDSVGPDVQLEACKVFGSALEVFYPSVTERSALLMQLFSEETSAPGMAQLLGLLLTYLAEDILNSDSRVSLKARLAEDVVFAALKVCIKESCNMSIECGKMNDEAFQTLVAKHPDLSPVLQYLTAVFFTCWREHFLSDDQESTVMGDDQVISDGVKYIESQRLSLKILEACQQILDVVLEVLSKLSEEYKGDIKSRVEGIEHVMKASLVGQTLPLLASVLSSDKFLGLPVTKSYLPVVTNVTVTATKVAYFVSELKSLEKDVVTGVTSTDVPSPWFSPRMVESPHPVRDDFQFCKTVVLPGASCLYLKFDPRCATQYEYDKVIIYAGKTTTGRRVAEYGGNSFGVGGRGVVRLGWPKEAVKVEGEAVTFSFQVKSARERNTPDHAVWGFCCTVSAKEHEGKPLKLPFFTDLCFSLSLLTHSLLNLMYHGPANSQAEDACQHLLDSKLLQRCVWPSTSENVLVSGSSGISITVDSEKGSSSGLDIVASKPSSKLSPELVKRLRDISAVPAPTLRPSLRQALQTDVIEELVLRCVIKHLGLTKTVQGIELMQATETEGDEYRYVCDVMREVFNRLNGLIRQLQTMAEMEQKWAHELDDVREGILQPSAAFFNDFHLQEAKSKELELLCSLKNIEFDPIEQEKSVGKLIERLETEVKGERQQSDNTLDLMPVTKKCLFSIMECGELLCNVTIESKASRLAALERSVSHCNSAPDCGLPTQQASLIQPQSLSGILNRSLSAPPKLDRSMSVQEGIHDVRRLQRWRTNVQRKHNRSTSEEETDLSLNKTFLSTVAEIFFFIGSDPDKAVTCSSFLSAAGIRNERGRARVQALQYMIELVSACSRIGTHHVPHLLSAVASILDQGPRTDELKCGGMVREVRDMFSAVVSAVVQQASTEPTVYRDSVLLLSVCPYSWHEERCVMRSSLVSLLDKLCCLRKEKTDAALNLSAMAWAGFKVLLDRIVHWENDKDFHAGAIEWSSLAHQVSSLLSNYLTCVLEESRHDEVSAKDALVYVMELLHGISRSRLGEGILREPRTVSTLLSLLLDRRAPPKLVLIVLKLCRSALPLMDAKSCQEVTLPTSARHYLGVKHGLHQEGSSVVRVAELLLAKLGDFVLPSVDSGIEDESESEAEVYEENDISTKSESTMCLYVHKRDDQPAHEVVQKVLSTNGTPFIFRVGQGSEMERAIKLDRELTDYGRGVLLTDTLSVCQKKAAQWAQTGLVVSVGPVDLLAEGSEGEKSVEGSGDPESVCKARNSRLSRTECSRPFISGQVAHTMASEVISLLHGLLSSSASDTSKIWASAVRDVLCETLDNVPYLIETLEREGRISPRGDQTFNQETEHDEDKHLSNEHEWFFKARKVVASLCALGGFQKNVHSGCTVQICGEDMVKATGEVVSVSERQGVATVLLNEEGETYSERVREIPLARLKIANPQVVFLSELSIGDQAVAVLLSILSTKETLFDQPSDLDAREVFITPSKAARILAEIKTRASMVLSIQVQDSSFIDALLANPSSELIAKLSGECDAGQRLTVLEKHCQQLRKLFKDFVKPAEIPKKVVKTSKRMALDSGRVFPPVRGCVFTMGQTCVHYLADPATGFGLPRGTFVYANAPLPQKAPSFYWEAELCSLGDPEDQDPGPSISVGFAPSTDQLASGWINPVGSCLLHSNGRAVLYRTGGLLHWKTVSLNIIMKENDVIGCGFERNEDQSANGLVYFTCNGDRLAGDLDGVQSGLWPVIHIQKKNVRVRVNFGARSFLYAEGSKHRAAADMWSDSMEDIRQGFSELPFAFKLDMDVKDESMDAQVVSKPLPPKPTPLTIPKDSVKEYDPLSCLQYKLASSYDRMVDVGPVTPLRASDEGTSHGREAPPVDPSRLLVKAWEDRVFPVIRRRFRSNTDRQSGLEQIRGALLAGMIDIAVATVADLYEDNGGIPASLQFPKLDDVKADVNKVSAGGLKPGQAVIINCSILNQASTLPGFAVPDMKKTFGLTGVVKSVDKPKGLAEVETYNREEGTLMSFWYPITALERPTAGLARSSSLALCSEDHTRAEIYCELLQKEGALTRMYCREAHSRLLEKQAKNKKQITDILSLLQTLATQLLAEPQVDGTIVMSSPHSAPDPRHCLTANTLQPSVLFFREPTSLVSAVRDLLSVTVEQDEEEVLRIVNTMCEVLKETSLEAYHREVSVKAGNPDEEVHIPGVAVTVVSCREDPGCINSGGVSNPRVTISCYHGNQKLNQNGQEARYKVVQYPNSDSYSSNKASLYPDLILPCNRLLLQFSTAATEGLVVHLNGFSAKFFLALVFIEVFVQVYLENAAECSSNSESSFDNNPENVQSKRRVLTLKTVAFNLTDIVCSYLLRSNLPAVIKEIIYHLLAQLIRACHHVKAAEATQLPFPDNWATFDTFLSRLSPLRLELRKLLEKELSVTNTAALDFILNCNFEHSEFSSYLQALLGLVSAVHEVSPSRGKSLRRLSVKAIHEALQAVESDSTDSEVRSAPPHSVENTFSFDPEAVTSSSATETASSSGPPSPKCFARVRRGSVLRRKRAYVHGVTSPTESMPWFDKIVSTTLLLRNLIHGDPRASPLFADSLAAVISTKSNALQRLLVITNIAPTLTKKEAVDAIKKACRPSGGIYDNKVYIPELQSRVSAEEPRPDVNSSGVDARVRSMTELLPSAQQDKPERILGYAVVQLKSASQLDLARQAVASSKTLKDPSTVEPVGVAKVNAELLMEGTNELAAFAVFDEFLNAKMFNTESEKTTFTESAKGAVAEIFASCARVDVEESRLNNSEAVQSNSAVNFGSDGSDKTMEQTQPLVKTSALSQTNEVSSVKFEMAKDERSETSSKQTAAISQSEGPLTKYQICSLAPGNLLLSFLNAVRHAKEATTEIVTQLLRDHGSPLEESEEGVLKLEGFINWLLARGSQDVRAIWKGIIACGYDLEFNRCTHFLPSEMKSDHASWTVAQDHALVRYVDTLCRTWSTTPSRLMPDELLLSDEVLASDDFHVLQGLSLRSVRSRFAFLKALNSDVERLLLPVTDFRAADSYSLSTATLLREARGLLFYHTKVALLNHVLNHTAHRRAEDSPPEISLDPLEALEADKVSSAGPQFCQAARHIATLSSSGLRVKVATGGDPVFPLKIHLQGEQVLGSGGSFRHFMWVMARELQGSHVGLLVPCPSSAANKNKGKFIMKPGPMTYSEEKLLIFFGQLLGIALRSDIPLALDLLPSFWKSLLNLPIDLQDDLRECDILTYNYIRRFSEVESVEEFQTICFEADLCPYRFVYTSIDGEEIELCDDGANIPVTWENHKSYVEAIRELRLRELRCESRMAAVRCGLSSVVPLHVLMVMTPLDMEIRTCGLPSVDLGFLKAHTAYVAGVKDTDTHIEFFWNSMENFSQDQLRKFVKFACNQERLPSRCTCQDGNPNTVDVHVPPYPMKIGPPDGRGPSDARYIRVETCMFMVKLPQYSTQEIMTEKLLYAVNCREDPLTDIS